MLLSLLLGCITLTKGIFSIWCEKKELFYNRTVAKWVTTNRPLHNAPLPAISSAPLASDLKRWLQLNPEVLLISSQKTCRCCVWSKPVYFKIDRLWFWWEKTHPKVKAVFWDTGPCVDNITGLQLVLSCPPWSDGKGKGQFTSQGGSAVELDLKIQVRRHCHCLRSPPLPPRPHLNYHMAFHCLKTHQNSFSPNIRSHCVRWTQTKLKMAAKCCMMHLRCVIVIKKQSKWRCFAHKLPR